MEKPKNRRKNYKNFENFDFIQYKGEWFVRFPNEREYVYFGNDRAAEFQSAIMAELKRSEKEDWMTLPEGIRVPNTSPYHLRDFAAQTAKQLLADA